MSRVISGFSTGATTFLGTSQGAQSSLGAGSAGNIKIRAIYGAIASSAAPDSSGGLLFRHSRQSSASATTIVLTPAPTSVGVAARIEGLSLDVGWFEFAATVAGLGAVGHVVVD